MKLIKQLSRLVFWEPPASTLAEKLLHEAESLALQHLLSAKHHQALADMYAERADFLRNHSATSITA